MLHLIGTGLHSIKNISWNAYQVIQTCDFVYLEYYTSVLEESQQQISDFLQKPVILATRNMVEQQSQQILEQAKTKHVAFLVIGDIFGATTHTQLLTELKEQHIPFTTHFNASILTAIGLTGLELYKFGKTTSMVFFADNWQPQTVYDVISMNKKQGLHTLILLDIKIAEPSKEDLLQQKQHVMPPTFMTIAQCIEQLFILEQVRNEHLITPHTQAVGCARLGGPDYMIKSGTLEILSTTDFGKPLHSLIIPGNLHFMEKEALELWK